MKTVFIFSLFILVNSSSEEFKSVDLLTMNKKIAAIMGSMHLPGMGVSTLAGKGDFTSKYFKQASSDFVRQTRKMAAIKHPDKAFRVFNDEMLKQVLNFEKSVVSEKVDDIKKSWSAVMATCQSCHSVYQAKQK